MTDTMKAATPWHLWAVGVVSLLWNGYGAYLFIMSNTRGEAFYRELGMPQAMIDYQNAMPMWMYVPWTVGVWGALFGSILLLLRQGLAVWAFGLSLIGAVVSLLYGKVIDPAPAPPPEMAVSAWMPYVIAGIAALLAWYAWAMRGRGVLR